MTRTLTLIAASFVLTLGATSCITTKKKGPPTREISHLPNNSPAAWEGGGGLGGMMPTSQ